MPVRYVPRDASILQLKSIVDMTMRGEVPCNPWFPAAHAGVSPSARRQSKIKPANR
jgi:hypothetical protein